MTAWREMLKKRSNTSILISLHLKRANRLAQGKRKENLSPTKLGKEF